MPTLVETRLAALLDPVVYARRAGIELDPWQQRAVRAAAAGKNVAIAAARQAGKGLASSLLAAWRVDPSGGHWLGVTKSRTPLVVTISASQRQAAFWLSYCRRTLEAAGAGLASDNQLELSVRGGGRIVAVPSGTSSRGYSADIAIGDEAAYLTDDDIAIVAATVAATGGVRMLISSPSGPTGAFADAVLKPEPGWHIEKVPYWDAPRLDRAFVEERRRKMRRSAFSNEFEASFEGDEGAVFERSALDALLATEPVTTVAPAPPRRGAIDNLLVA